MMLYIVLLIPVYLIGVTLCMFSLAEVTINFSKRTYETLRRWPWRTTVHRGRLDEFEDVYVTDKGYVSLVGGYPGVRKVIPLGTAGLGTDGVEFAQEVARRGGLKLKYFTGRLYA